VLSIARKPAQYVRADLLVAKALQQRASVLILDFVDKDTQERPRVDSRTRSYYFGHPFAYTAVMLKLKCGKSLLAAWERHREQLTPLQSLFNAGNADI